MDEWIERCMSGWMGNGKDVIYTGNDKDNYLNW